MPVSSWDLMLNFKPEFLSRNTNGILLKNAHIIANMGHDRGLSSSNKFKTAL